MMEIFYEAVYRFQALGCSFEEANKKAKQIITKTLKTQKEKK